MTKSTITREESIQAVFDLKVGYTLGLADIEILKRVARIALAAMDSEPEYLPLDYLQGQAIRKGPDMPPAQPVECSEPVAEVYQAPNVGICAALGPSIRMLCPLEPGTKLYLHAQPTPVSMKDHQIRELVNELRDIAIEHHSTQQLRERIARTVLAAILAAARQSPGSEPATVPGKWIPVSERMPENDGAYLCWDNRYVTTYAFIFGAWQANQFIAKNITHWMPLPAAPQEVK